MDIITFLLGLPLCILQVIVWKLMELEAGILFLCFYGSARPGKVSSYQRLINQYTYSTVRVTEAEKRVRSKNKRYFISLVDSLLSTVERVRIKNRRRAIDGLSQKDSVSDIAGSGHGYGTFSQWKPRLESVLFILFFSRVCVIYFVESRFHGSKR